MTSLKYLRNFWKTFEMPLVNCGVSLMLSWSKDRFLVKGKTANQKPIFTINDTKLYETTRNRFENNN